MSVMLLQWKQNSFRLQLHKKSLARLSGLLLLVKNNWNNVLLEYGKHIRHTSKLHWWRNNLKINVYEGFNVCDFYDQEFTSINKRTKDEAFHSPGLPYFVFRFCYVGIWNICYFLKSVKFTISFVSTWTVLCSL